VKRRTKGTGDTHRRWSHRIPPGKRERELGDLLARVLRQYATAVASDTYEHPCDSCATDVAIFTDKARALGVAVDADPVQKQRST
jgi:hypothetical protein